MHQDFTIRMSCNKHLLFLAKKSPKSKPPPSQPKNPVSLRRISAAHSAVLSVAPSTMFKSRGLSDGKLKRPPTSLTATAEAAAKGLFPSFYS